MTHRNTKQPKNSITLMNGEALECFPKQSPQTKFASDEMQLNTTGAYLGMGIKPCKPQPNADEEKERQKKLFTDNAFYLLAHSERIMRDSRMFLAPVAVQNGLAYTGTSGFNAPTVGIYLEWWATFPEALRTDKEGCRSLVFHLAGSPLSGNHSRLSTHGMTRLSTSIKSTRLSRCLTSCTLRIVKIGTILLKSRSALCNLRLTN